MFLNLTDQKDISEMTKMYSNFQQNEHSQIQQIGPGQTQIKNECPPQYENDQAVKNQQDDMQPGNRLKCLNILFILRGQFKASLKPEMPNLAKPPRGIDC